MAAAGLVVVGASLAGLRAVEAARNLGYSGSVTLIGAETSLPYDRPPLSKQFLESLDSADPVLRDETHLRDELGVHVRLGQPATGVDCAERVLHVGSDEVAYSALVIATGADARTLPGTDRLGGVHTLRNLEDARRIRDALCSGARTVVVGAGFIGSEVASAAMKHGVEVTLVEAAPVPLSRAVGPRMGARLGELHRENGVELRLGVSVSQFNGRERVESVLLSDGTRLPADLVVVGIGANPSTGWLVGSGLRLDERDGGVWCDATLATGAPGVYACGDVCHWPSNLFGGRLRLEHWTNAAEQGVIAARNALYPADAVSYDPVPYFWSDWYGKRIQFVGSSDCDEVVVADESRRSESKLLALYRKDDRIVGALTIDRPGVIMKARRLIAQRAPWGDGLVWAKQTLEK